jgi:hypothetical protein
MHRRTFLRLTGVQLPPAEPQAVPRAPEPDAGRSRRDPRRTGPARADRDPAGRLGHASGAARGCPPLARLAVRAPRRRRRRARRGTGASRIPQRRRRRRRLPRLRSRAARCCPAALHGRSRQVARGHVGSRAGCRWTIRPVDPRTERIPATCGRRGERRRPGGSGSRGEVWSPIPGDHAVERRQDRLHVHAGAERLPPGRVGQGPGRSGQAAYAAMVRSLAVSPVASRTGGPRSRIRRGRSADR